MKITIRHPPLTCYGQMMVRPIAWLVLSAIVTVATPAHGVGKTGKQIILFDPDANFQAMADILMWLRRHVEKTVGAYEIKAVKDARTFEKEARDPATRFTILGSSYFTGRWKAKLKPLLVANTTAGSEVYNKVLLARSFGDAKQPTLTTVAVAGAHIDKAERSAIASAMQARGIRLKSSAFMSVSKDIDALLALVFRQVDGALVTQTSLEALRTISPDAIQSLQQLWKSRPILMPLFCSVAGRTSDTETRAMETAFRTMSEATEGRNAIQTMGISAWVPIRASLREQLR